MYIAYSTSRQADILIKDMKLLIILFCVVLSTGHSTSVPNLRKFPEEFIFGASTASYQIEGGWNANDKGENIFDRLSHTIPDFVKDHSNGDVAADTYHNYKRDVEMMRELGLNAYRFSTSWSRILPNGFSNYISDAGIAFYNNYINEMLKYNIQPIITLYHWDLPQNLQDLGGFLNPLIADWFEDYARVAFTHFGDRVKLWITINEPRELCDGYSSAIRAPRINASGIGDYICTKNLLIAHAKAYHAYKNDFKATQGGQCGISLHVASADPLTNTDEDRLAVELHKQGQWGLFTEPIFSEQGGFPKELAQKVAQKSAAQGYARSRMPEFSEEERIFVRGTSDFFGVNHYYGTYVSASEYIKDDSVPSLGDDMGVGYYMPDDWPQSASLWLKQTPNSMFKALSHLNERYNNTTFYITENGWSSLKGLVDEGRVNYYRASLESLLDALDAGISVKGYMAWSLMDNFEWRSGYTVRFGLYEVDFEDPARTRTARKSAFIYKDIIKMRTINHDYEPDITAMTIDAGHCITGTEFDVK